jgi:hypothetical protein
MSPNRPKRTQKLCSYVLIVGLGMLGSACHSRGTKTDLKQIAGGPASKVYELAIQKSDPEHQEYWTAVLTRNANEQWRITSPPADQEMGDRMADEVFINHLLDALQQVQLEKEAPNGALETFGLSSPIFSVRWKTSDQEAKLYVGHPLKGKATYYLSLDGKKIWEGSGSGLRMLYMIDSFQKLRRRAWSLFTSDDVDEIEFFRQGRRVFYAQREGNSWTNRRHSAYSAPIDQLIDAVTGAVAIAFIDRVSISKHALFEVRLTDRHGKTEIYQLRKAGTNLHGTLLSRPQTIFVFDSKSRLAQALRQPWAF